MKLNNNSSKDYYELRLQNLNTYRYEKLGCVLTIRLESTSSKTSYLPKNEVSLPKLLLKLDSLETSIMLAGSVQLYDLSLKQLL